MDERQLTLKDAADEWWDSLPAARRAQIHSWVTPSREPKPQLDGQVDALDLIPVDAVA